MAECHGGKLFVDMLEREGVRHIFMLSGESLLPIIDACIDSPISIIHTRHEESAGYMADAYARVTGGLGVVGVTQGPGSTNIFTALMTANLDASPMLCFAGRLNQGMMHRLAETPREAKHRTQAGSKHTVVCLRWHGRGYPYGSLF